MAVTVEHKLQGHLPKYGNRHSDAENCVLGATYAVLMKHESSMSLPQNFKHFFPYWHQVLYPGIEKIGVEYLYPVGGNWNLLLIDCQTGAFEVEQRDGSHWAPY